MNVFTYGSLMFPGVWRRVTGVAMSGEAGTLEGFRRFAIRGRAYPGVVAAANASVAGVVYRSVAPEVVARLDAFEDVMYERLTRPVRFPEGAVLPCEVYVVADDYQSWVSSQAWEPEVFERDHLRRFLQGDEAG